MHRSGIAVGEELKKAFHDACTDPEAGLLKVHVQNESFILDQRVKTSGSVEGDFKLAQSLLAANAAVYIFIKQDPAQQKWIFVSHVPENAQVRDKMLYASSRSSLKDGLGSQSFSADFFITHAEECTHDDFLKSRLQDATEDMLTWEERMKLNAHSESVKSVGSVRIAAIADIPIKVSEDAVKLIKEFVAKQHVAVFFDLDPDTEVLMAFAESKATLELIQSKLSPRDPRFCLFRFMHEEKKESKSANLFIYYCPDAAIPKLKMFYSAAKAMVVRLLKEQFAVEITKNIEISDPKELTAKDLMDELYPRTVAKKAIVKPKAAGKGPARLHKSAGFTNPAAAASAPDS